MVASHRSTRREASRPVAANRGRVTRMSTTVNRGGRPRLDRDRHTWKVRVSPEMHRALDPFLEQSGMGLGVYVEYVLAAAHDYHGPYMRDLDLPLPMAVDLDTLRSKVERITRDDCISVIPAYNVQKWVRGDRPLADKVDEICLDLGDVPRADYIRAVISIAVGYGVHGRGVQTPLSDELMGGATRRRSA